jgi:hypothetical protein
MDDDSLDLSGMRPAVDSHHWQWIRREHRVNSIILAHDFNSPFITPDPGLSPFATSFALAMIAACNAPWSTRSGAPASDAATALSSHSGRSIGRYFEQTSPSGCGGSVTPDSV